MKVIIGKHGGYERIRVSSMKNYYKPLIKEEIMEVSDIVALSSQLVDSEDHPIGHYVFNGIFYFILSCLFWGIDIGMLSELILVVKWWVWLIIWIILVIGMTAMLLYVDYTQTKEEEEKQRRYDELNHRR